MPEVKVSVVMSVYNAEKYLRESIESILNQTFTDFDFIIVNDGSTDSSLEILESYKDDKIVLINQNNTGLAKALNNGIDKSKSDLIARMDADDISLPDRLLRQYNFLKENSEYIAVGSSAINIDLDGNYVFVSYKPISNKEIKKSLPKTPFYHSSVMFRKKIFQKSGKYCEAMLKAQDTVLFNRMAKFGKYYNFEEPLIKYRVVPTANSLRNNLGDRFSQILKKAINKNKISNADSIYLSSILNNRESSIRLANYYLFLAKKYLWDNNQPNLSRINLAKSIKNHFRIVIIILFIISYFPEKIIRKFYKKIKNIL